MLDVLNDLDNGIDHAKLILCAIEAEQIPEASQKFKIVAVPTVVFSKASFDILNCVFPILFCLQICSLQSQTCTRIFCVIVHDIEITYVILF